MSLQSSSVGVEQWSAHVLQSFRCPLAVCRYLGIHTAKARRTWRVAHLQRNAQLAIQVGYRSSLTWNAILSSVPNFFLYAALTPWPRLLLCSGVQNMRYTNQPKVKTIDRLLLLRLFCRAACDERVYICR